MEPVYLNREPQSPLRKVEYRPDWTQPGSAGDSKTIWHTPHCHSVSDGASLGIGVRA
ncbi:hypothetical protein J6590_001187 [Homalodisca vitripennis]|nr:hypothetical protein J6590_001187 [Homalodisca vitripennis]